MKFANHGGRSTIVLDDSVVDVQTASGGRFGAEEWDARAILRSGGTDGQLAALVRASIGAKRAGHGINSEAFLKPQRAMYQIGG